jgi:hypothetical protein
MVTSDQIQEVLMSRRSVLLATTICSAIACAASADLALAHGGGGGHGGFGGGFGGGAWHSFGGGFHPVGAAPALARPAAPAYHWQNHNTKVGPAMAGIAASHRKVFKAGNGVTPTGSSVSPNQSVLPKSAIPATQSVPPTPIKAGTIVDKPAIPTATQSVPPTPVKAGTIADNPAIPTAAQSVPPTPVKAGTIVDKPAIPVVAQVPTTTHPTGLGTIVNKPPIPSVGFPAGNSTNPGTTPPPPMHPMQGPIASFGGIVIEGAVVDGLDLPMQDTGCYWIRRKFVTPEGEVIRRVRVCETVEVDRR